MDQVIQNPWLSALVVLVTQIVFLYARTLNVMYTAERKLVAALISGNIIGIAWLISISVGVSAIMNMQWQPVMGHILGGSIGVIMAFKSRKK